MGHVQHATSFCGVQTVAQLILNLGTVYNATMSGHAPRDVRELTAAELHDLIADTKSGCSDAISKAVAFVASESLGYWHNRARAKLCRHFKNHPPASNECERMFQAVCGRLISGKFYEQFKDQLSMAIRFDCDRMKKVANVAIKSEREYIRRYGRHVLHAIDSIRR